MDSPGSHVSFGRSEGHNAFQIVGIASLLVSLWLATHPYSGILRDGRFYFLQALNAAQPGRFSDDLYFKFGSQDRFSLFAQLFRPLVSVFSPDLANAIGLAIGFGLWLAAAFAFVLAFVDGWRERLAALVAIIVANSGYGSSGIFSYGETALTPRLLAEAFVMLGLASAFRKQFLRSFLFFAVGTGLHPLISAIGIGCVAFSLALRHRLVWLAFGATAAASIGLALLGVDPFARLLQVMDADWLAIVKARSAFAFVTTWSVEEWVRSFAVLVSLGLGTISLPRARTALFALIVAICCTLAASAGLGDYLHSVLIIDVQLWRSLWLGTLVANGCLAVTAIRAPKGFVSGAILWLALALSSFSHFLPIGTLTGSVVSILGAITYLVELKVGALSMPRRLVPIVASSVSTFLVLLQGLSALQVLNVTVALEILVSVAAIGLLIVLNLVHKFALLSVGSLLLAASFVNVDHRSNWQRFVEGDEDSPGLNQFLAGSGNLYWEADPVLVWVKLRKPEFFSCAQGTGAMFFRATAIEFRSRANLIGELETADLSRVPGSLCPEQPKTDPAIPFATRLADVCRAAPGLDTLVLIRPIPGLPAREWVAPEVQRVLVNGKVVNVNRYYRYDCPSHRTPKA